jgi:hypothetical protein
MITHLTIPVDETFFNDCIGEVHLTGVTDVLIVINADASGAVHVEEQDTFQGVAINLTTGDFYRASGVARGDELLKPPLFPATITVVRASHFISPTGPDLLIHFLFHFTITPDFNVTAFVTFDDATCR